jgi:multimeric flavodoxin WrbA
MKIIVLNGSPKGNLSGTLQYVAYLEKANKQHQFETIHISQTIRAIENSQEKFDGIIQKIENADGVIWSFPLYFMMVHGGFKRFIELVFERNAEKSFAGKYSAVISTSIHFYDHTAHAYMRAICDDLKMQYTGGFSPASSDLLKEKHQKQLLEYGKHFFDAIEQKKIFQPKYAPVKSRDFTFAQGNVNKTVDPENKRVVILHDALEEDHNLKEMVAHTQATFDGKAEVYNIREVNIKGNCQGCMQCGGSFHCSYEGKDDYIEFYKNTVMQADILIYAGTIKDRYLSARWKTFFDRSFFNTHTPVLINKQIMFLVSGELDQNANLRQIIESYFEFQWSNLTGIVSDDSGTSQEIDQYIEQTSAECVYNSKEQVSRPMTFLGVGGIKIFRDDIWGPLRMVFPADYKAFRKLGYFKTFPQRSFTNFLMHIFVVPLLSIPAVRKVFNSKMKEQMIMPLQKNVAKAKF